MKISAIDAFPITLPVNRGVTAAEYTAKGFRSVSALVVLEITTDAGISGLGEATVSGRWSGETQMAALGVLKSVFAPILMGREPLESTSIMERIDHSILGFPFTKAAVEMALLDIAGKALGVPVYSLLGGPVRPRSIPIRFPVVPTEPATAAALAKEVVSRNCSMIKLKVGHDTVEKDVERVAHVRDAIGPNIRITVDANGGWSVSQSIAACRQLRGYGVLFVEQPVDRLDIEGMAEVRRRVDLPIMADEGVFTLRQTIEVIRRRAADIISVYPGKNGGIRNAACIAQVAGSCGIASAIGSNLEGQIGSSAMAHLAVAVRNINVEAYNADIIGPLFHTESVVKEPMEARHDAVYVPDGPGLGLSISRERLATAVLRGRQDEGQATQDAHERNDVPRRDAGGGGSS